MSSIARAIAIKEPTRMLHTQYNGTNFAGLGALVSSASTADLQRYLVSIGKLAQSNVTGVMNDATMAVVYNLFVTSAATVAKIPLLPQNIRDGISKVTSALKAADDKIRSVSFGRASLSSVFSNWATINALVRSISSSAADAMASARESVYNAISGYAGTITAALKVFFSPAGSTQQPTVVLDTAWLTTLIKPFPGTGLPAGQQALPSGTIYAFSKKLGQYRIAIPRVNGGLGIQQGGVFGGCVFGDCGLGSAVTMTEVAPSATPPPGGTPTTETELEKKTGTLPLYKKWQFWTAIGGGVAAVGTGTALLMRRKRSA